MHWESGYFQHGALCWTSEHWIFDKLCTGTGVLRNYNGHTPLIPSLGHLKKFIVRNKLRNSANDLFKAAHLVKLTTFGETKTILFNVSRK